MSETRILRRDVDGLCILTLNRPDKLNAFDNAMLEALEAHLTALEGETDRIGCVMLKGAGRAFCAGADLGGIAASGGSPAPDKRWKPRLMERLGNLPQPTIAAVHGVCFTGGLEFALACDFILAEEGTRFADTHGKWGFISEWGMLQRLPRRVGEAMAKRMMFTACEVDAAKALAIGLVDELAPAGGLDAAAEGLARAILGNSWHANIGTKRLMRETDGMGLAEAMAHAHFRYPGFAPDWQERIARFKTK